MSSPQSREEKPDQPESKGPAKELEVVPVGSGFYRSRRKENVDDLRREWEKARIELRKHF